MLTRLATRKGLSIPEFKTANPDIVVDETHE